MSSLHRSLLIVSLLGFVAGSWPASAQPNRLDAEQVVVEEDLDDVGLEALPPVFPPLDETEVEATFAEALEIFESPDQDASLSIFGRVVDLLEPRAAANQLSPPLRELLARSLAFRARLYFNFGEIGLVDEALRRMLEIRPESDLDREQASPKLVRQFDALRRRILGEITFVLEPADSQVRIDARVVDAISGPVPVLAGQRQIMVSLPGYAPVIRPLEVAPDVGITLDLALERTSAVVRLLTRPAGAEVLLDGAPYGKTAGTAPEGFLPQGAAAAYRGEEFSDELIIEGIEPGLVILEVQLAGYRRERFELSIYELLDYPVPPIVLEKERGSLSFNNFPTGAEIRIDGEARSPDNPGSRKPVLALPPGTYHVTVSAGPSKMFSTRLQLADRQRMEVDVDLRPGLAFLGVLGGDAETARNLDQSLRVALADSGRWTLINRSAEASSVLREAGVSAETLRRVEADSAAGSRSSIDWKRVQKAMDENVPGLAYILAVPANDLVSTYASIWIWPSAPGPSEPDRTRLPLGDPSALNSLKDSFNRTLRLQRAWVGATVIDTQAAPHPLVIEVSPASPAEAAGVRVGDLIAGVAGVPVTTRAAFDERIAAAEIGETIDLAAQSADGARLLKLTIGSSPDLLAARRADLFDSIAFAELVLLAEQTPPDRSWIVEIDQALILLRANEWTEAARRLRGIKAPQTSHGVGQATVDYLLGIALSAAGPDFREGARQHFDKAAAIPGARLFHNDGAWIAPRARARLLALGR